MNWNAILKRCLSKENRIVKSVNALALLMLCAGSVQAECAMDSTTINARFALQDKSLYAENGGNKIRSSELVLWKRTDEMALDDGQRNITEYWNRVGNDGVHLIRYFNDFERGIEYQSAEINNGRGAGSWANKSQLLSPQLRDKMTLTKVEGEGCELIEHYSLVNGKVEYQLKWSPILNLPVEYNELRMSVSDQRTFSVQLVSTNRNVAKIDRFFDEKSAYQTTDYADIGDNENDPFLVGMINLGFIGNTGTGFYGAHKVGKGDASHNGHRH